MRDIGYCQLGVYLTVYAFNIVLFGVQKNALILLCIFCL